MYKYIAPYKLWCGQPGDAESVIYTDAVAVEVRLLVIDEFSILSRFLGNISPVLYFRARGKGGGGGGTREAAAG